jgi:catechol 2,3-dioxygenase-like lactoylglutathione lyase family enzyme
MNFNKLIPELSVSNFEKSLKFYTEILGFKVEYSRKNFAFLSFQGSQIMIDKINDVWSVGKLKHPFGRGINMQFEVKSIKPILNKLKGYRLFKKTKNNWYEKGNSLLGNREFLIQDPDGYLLRFTQDLGTKK